MAKLRANYILITEISLWRHFSEIIKNYNIKYRVGKIGSARYSKMRLIVSKMWKKNFNCELCIKKFFNNIIQLINLGGTTNFNSHSS